MKEDLKYKNLTFQICKIQSEFKQTDNIYEILYNIPKCVNYESGNFYKVNNKIIYELLDSTFITKSKILSCKILMLLYDMKYFDLDILYTYNSNR